MSSFDRPYILQEFPHYDYSNPVNPWDVDIDRPNGARNCTWQMQAFHYRWAIAQCQDSGEIGISIGIPNLPYCLAIPISALSTVVDKKTAPLIIASSYVQQVPCLRNGLCQGYEVRTALEVLIPYLKPGGKLIIAAMDERYSHKHGRSLKGPEGMSHTWSPSSFYSRILRPLTQENKVDLVEFDTFRNGMSFNVVLERQ